jgi:hypothetical protein
MAEAEKILILKLASGEEIIADSVVDDINIYVKDCVQIINIPDNTGQSTRTAFMPWAPYADSFVISRIGTHIGMPGDKLIRAYKEMVSGIELPDTSIQIATA